MTKDLQDKLVTAVHDNEGASVRQLIEKGANASDPRVLMTAIERRNVAMTKMLIKHGADVNCQDEAGDTPLHKATLVVMKPLIEAGARCDIANHAGQRALHSQSEMHSFACVRILLDHGAAVNHVDNHDCNALWACVSSAAIAAHKRPVPCYHGPSCQVFDLLLQAGADPHIVAYADGWRERPQDAHNLVYLSCEEGHGIRLQELVNMGVDVNFATPPGCFPAAGDTALHVCARRSFDAMMKVLIDAGANVSAQNEHGETPMDLLDGDRSVKGRREKCRKLLAQAMGAAGGGAGGAGGAGASTNGKKRRRDEA